MELIREIKGIKKLVIEDADFNHLKESVFIGIYGANGAGKSSLKLAISEGTKAVTSFGAKDEDKYVHDDIILGQNQAIFDERMVSLVRSGVKKGVFLFNKEIKTLYELLTDRQETINHSETNDIINNLLLKIDVQDISQRIQELTNAASTIQDNFSLKNSVEAKQANKHVIRHVQTCLNKAFAHYLSSTPNYDGNTQTFDTKNINMPKLKLFFEKVFQDEQISKEVQLDAAKECKELIKKFENIFFITSNFGYVELENQLDDLINLSFLNNGVGQNNNKGDKLFQLITALKDDVAFISFKNTWNKIRSNVLKVIEMANNILGVYKINYTVNLYPSNTHGDFQNNFSLVHSSSNKYLTESDIETSVSFGELNIIALSLFISSCLMRGIPENTTFIFDDPISSYDLNRVQMTISIIKGIVADQANVNKIYFLSHEKHFIKTLKFSFKNITFWNLIKNESSRLKKVAEMETDFDFYLNAYKDPNSTQMTKAITSRYFSVQGNNLPEVDINKKDANDKYIHPKGNALTKMKEVITDINKIDISEFNKYNFIGFRDEIRINNEGFKEWLIEKSDEITIKLASKQILNEEDFLILRTSLYRNTLNSISHEEFNNSNLDISRASEVADILFANKKEFISDFKNAIELYEESLSDHLTENQNHTDIPSN